ncbi:MAG: hypothetical protein KAR19_04130 [Bacteroidales bacterium]|nr:hypothetical protein [Bacteroidales bacterium]
MSLRQAIFLAGTIIAVGLTSIVPISCNSRSMEGMVVFTRVPIDNFDFQEDIIHNFPGAQIVAVNPDKPEGSEVILTTDFYSACSPEISYDAKQMLFVAQRNEHEPWQVWEMDLKNGTSKQITDFGESCSGPAYLPAGRLVFSRQIPGRGAEPVYALFTMNLDGSNISRITFQPHNDYPAGILRDGRILMFSKQLYPKAGDIMYLAMRPNGTKAELFYKGVHNSILHSQAYETMDGLVYFIEWEQGRGEKGEIVSVYQNRPLFSKVNYTSEFPGSFYALFPMPSGELLVSYRPSETDPVALYSFSVQEKSLGESIYNHTEYHVLEPVLVEAYSRPRNLPDEVDDKQSTGLLLCQNINVTATPFGSELNPLLKATRVELLGIDKSLGIVPVEEDGSVYLKVIADTPVRFQTLDEDGRIVYGPSAWIWLRPFERRGCVGCHEDPELSPENFVPLSVKKQPVSIPVESTQEHEHSSTVIIVE